MNKIFIIDVDGVLASGQFFYTSKGKVMKVFGPHDNDGLKILKKYMQLFFVSADKRGFEITKKRVVDDMGFELFYTKEGERLDFLKKYGYKNIIYMGDGYHDKEIFKKVFYAIAPNNALRTTKKYANFITKSDAAKGAVFEACEHVFKHILKKKNF